MKKIKSHKLRAKLRAIRKLARDQLFLKRLQKIRKRLEQKGKSRYVVYIYKRDLQKDEYRLFATKFTFSSDSRHACEKMRPRRHSHLYCLSSKKVL